ncbi:MAG: lipoate--protein ligase [Ignavibacteria bacterium]|nr:lipoate--protein ligase [Ignavibacteria bacterium]
MLFINNKNNHDPYLNLALEEYCLRNVDISETYLLFYINEPSIIIGKNQNTLEEINHEYVRENNIHVVRRISGGGTVYHDHGNLNFSFITKYDPKHFNNYKEFTGPVINVLHKLGVNAELSGRNDILVDGKKISGNAQFTNKDRMFSHGTLLFDSAIDNVVAALNVKIGKIESKGIKSVRSRVTNISEYMEQKMTTEEFRQTLLAGIFNGETEIPQLHLTEEDWQKVTVLADKKYRTWDWNYGLSPKFNLQKTKRFPIGEIDIRFQVENGIIESLKIYGDFFGQKDVKEIELLLTGVKYESSELHKILQYVDVTEYFGNISLDELMEVIY